MPEDKPQQEEVKDSRGIPITNKVAELERKLNEKDERYLNLEKELNELKTWKQQAQTEVQEPESTGYDPKQDLTQFVGQPREFIRKTLWEVEVEKQKPEAEAWLKGQKTWKPEFETEIVQIIHENQLGGMPMQRARTAWQILEARHNLSRISSEEDERKRQAAITKAGGEGTGSSISKERQVTRNDVLRQLSEAERKGDLDASIKLIEMLEDIR